MDVSAYRIVQEALTNALRHGDGRTARRPDLAATADRVDIDVHQPGAARGGTGGSGLGLVGMAERVAVLGGRRWRTAGAGDRYVLDVTLPVAEVPA